MFLLLFLWSAQSGKYLRKCSIIPKVFHLAAFLLFSSGSALEQPLSMILREGESTTLNCFQKQTQYSYMYWFKQERGKDTRLQLVIFSTESSGGKDDVEEEFKKRFKTSGAKNYKLPMLLENAQLEDTGTYFCAKRDYTV